MNTSVTGIFPDRASAIAATRALIAAGFRGQHIEVVDGKSLGPRNWIASRFADAQRAMLAGALVGGLGGAASALLLGAGAVGVLLAGLALAVAGAALGTVVGRSTASQIRAELEHGVRAGRVLVTVTTDAAHAELLLSILARDAGASVVSSRAGFRASILSGRA